MEAAMPRSLPVTTGLPLSVGLRDCSQDAKNASALVNHSLANYVFGDFAKAVGDAEKALNYCEDQRLSSFVVTAKMNLGYFIAEAHFHDRRHFGLEHALRAKKLIQEALANVPAEKKAKYLDTYGAVEIACGETEAEIRAGLASCQEALSLARVNHRDSPLVLRVAEAFYKLHEHRAFRRLID